MKKAGVAHLKIQDIMTSNIFCTNPSMSLREIIKQFLDRGISGAPVIQQDSGVLVSVVSEADLMKFAAIGSLDEPLFLHLDKLPEQDELVVVLPEDPFSEAFKKFLTKPVRRVVVIDNYRKPVGIVSRRDIIKSFLEHENDLEK